MSVRSYLDHAAGSPLTEAVLEAMRAHLSAGPAGSRPSPHANASSLHREGRAARAVIDDSRALVAESLGVLDDEILFTGSGTEAVNLALRGSCWAADSDCPQLVVSAVEHASVLRTARWLAARGQARLTEVPVDSAGRLSVDAVLEAVEPDTALVSVGHVNGETGVIAPVAELGEALRQRGLRFHVDAVQALGKLPVEPRELPCDLLSLSGHKVGGPPGCGLNFVREGLKLHPVLTGGEQEMGLRPGTESVLNILGTARAVADSVSGRAEHADTMKELGQHLEEGLLALPGVRVNGSTIPRVPGIVNARFEGARGSAVMQALDLAGFAVSTGSACSSGSLKPSHVLTAMGQSEDEARAAVRFSLGYGNDRSRVDELLGVLPGILDAARLEVPS